MLRIWHWHFAYARRRACSSVAIPCRYPTASVLRYGCQYGYPDDDNPPTGIPPPRWRLLHPCVSILNPRSVISDNPTECSCHYELWGCREYPPHCGWTFQVPRVDLVPACGWVGHCLRVMPLHRRIFPRCWLYCPDGYSVGTRWFPAYGRHCPSMQNLWQYCSHGNRHIFPCGSLANAQYPHQTARESVLYNIS